jgi:hypothetical protein
MLAQLSTVKDRLALSVTTYDTLLTNAIKAVSARLDHLTNRTLVRTVDFTQEFIADETELVLSCYPLESVSSFELKSSESEGWLVQTDVDYLIRSGCVISFANPLGSSREQARVTYTGGYVLPGATPAPGQTSLPNDLEQACVEQVTFWFRNKDVLGLIRNWPSGGTYQVFSQAELLPSVLATAKANARWVP